MRDKSRAIDDLAKMIDEGFKTMAAEDAAALRTEMKEKFEEVNSHLNTLDARMGRIEADVHALHEEMVHRQEFYEALDLNKYVEKKLSIESGV